jgi:hypothetical protein
MIVQELLARSEKTLQPEDLPVFALDAEGKRFPQFRAHDQVALVEVFVGARHENAAAVGLAKLSSKSLYLGEITRYCGAATAFFFPPRPPRLRSALDHRHDRRLHIVGRT